MNKTGNTLVLFVLLLTGLNMYGQPPLSYIPADIYPTEKGNLEVTLVGHGSVMFYFDGKIIHVDPYSKVADYSRLPKADLIILTHEHPDHLDKEAIDLIKKEDTYFIVTPICKEILGYGESIQNGERTSFNGNDIEAVPAYNMIHKNPQGEFYHPKGRGNGYIFSFADKRVYVAGDTENIPEMYQFTNMFDIAFLPKNLPYTMTDEMFIDAAKMIKPNYLYPYHFSEFEEISIGEALRNEPIELIVCPMSNK
ncbi:MAG: MBL fold metallo-hydrolase [Candidatus Azobacteroides sp.]|nr:MBL fold metallo-hydrolase [Candidatus Azobacteroides sp.]